MKQVVSGMMNGFNEQFGSIESGLTNLATAVNGLEVYCPLFMCILNVLFKFKQGKTMI
jgi:hypothetical protein